MVSVHDLSRRPGNSRRLEHEIAAPAGLGTAVIGIAEGSPIRFDLTLTSVAEGIYVTGTADVVLEGECVRCLDPVRMEVPVDLAELYLYPEAHERAEDERDEEAVEMFTTDGEVLDLEPMLRDTVVIGLPFQPLCRPDCPGLCPVCGERLADLPADHSHEVIDPRLRVLEGYFETGSAE